MGAAAGAAGTAAGVGGGSAAVGARVLEGGADSTTSARFPSIFFLTTFFLTVFPRLLVEPRALGESVRFAPPFGGLIGGGLGAVLVGVAFFGAIVDGRRLTQTGHKAHKKICFSVRKLWSHTGAEGDDVLGKGQRCDIRDGTVARYAS